MTGKELWQEFVKKNNLTDCKHEEWAFGVEADLLAHLVAVGEKTATASAYPLYELENEALPITGVYSVILDSKDNHPKEDSIWKRKPLAVLSPLYEKLTG